MFRSEKQRTQTWQPLVPTQRVQQADWTLPTHPLLVIGDDAADETGVGIAECGHEAAQRFLVELPHSPEHPTAGATSRRTIPEAAHLLQPHNALHCGGTNRCMKRIKISQL